MNQPWTKERECVCLCGREMYGMIVYVYSWKSRPSCRIVWRLVLSLLFTLTGALSSHSLRTFLSFFFSPSLFSSLSLTLVVPFFFLCSLQFLSKHSRDQTPLLVDNLEYWLKELSSVLITHMSSSSASIPPYMCASVTGGQIMKESKILLLWCLCAEMLGEHLTQFPNDKSRVSCEGLLLSSFSFV